MLALGRHRANGGALIESPGRVEEKRRTRPLSTDARVLDILEIIPAKRPPS